MNVVRVAAIKHGGLNVPRMGRHGLRFAQVRLSYVLALNRRNDAVSTVMKMGRDYRFRLGTDELRPRRPRPRRCWLTTRVPQDLPHRRRGDPVAELVEFVVDPPVPGRGTTRSHRPGMLRSWTR